MKHQQQPSMSHFDALRIALEAEGMYLQDAFWGCQLKVKIDRHSRIELWRHPGGGFCILAKKHLQFWVVIVSQESLHSLQLTVRPWKQAETQKETIVFQPPWLS